MTKGMAVIVVALMLLFALFSAAVGGWCGLLIFLGVIGFMAAIVFALWWEHADEPLFKRKEEKE